MRILAYKSLIRITPIILLISCGNGTSHFRGETISEYYDNGEEEQKDPEQEQTPEIIASKDEIDEENSGFMLSAYSVSSQYSYSSQEKPIDYLIVLDNSTSMSSVIDNLKFGISSMTTAGKFPENSKIAVTSTMIADYNDLMGLHKLQRNYNGALYEPGFLKLIDKNNIDNFINNTYKFADQFPLEGCDDAWFSPSQFHINGHSCLEAAVQITAYVTAIEAGIHSLTQLVLVNADSSLFRENAHVNVIFVSDTHDPGQPESKTEVQELIDSQLNSDEIIQLIKQNNNVSSVKFHAIAPLKKCSSEPEMIKKSYFELAQDSGGLIIDICDKVDYGTEFSKIIDLSTAPEAFNVPEQVVEIDRVLINNSEIENYVFDSESKTVTLIDLPTDTQLDINIEYLIDENDLSQILEENSNIKVLETFVIETETKIQELTTEIREQVKSLKKEKKEKEDKEKKEKEDKKKKEKEDKKKKEKEDKEKKEKEDKEKKEKEDKEKKEKEDKEKNDDDDDDVKKGKKK